MPKISRKTGVFIMVFLTVLAAGLLALVVTGLKHREQACPGGKVDLQGRGEIIEYASDDGILRLRLKKPGSEETEVVLVDECTGRIKGALTIDDNALKLPKY